MISYAAPNIGLPPVLAAALSGALPTGNMQSPGQLAGRVDAQNASAFMPTPPQPQQTQMAMPNPMGGMNPYAQMLQPKPQNLGIGGGGNVPGYGQVQLPNSPALQQQGPLGGVLPWLRGMFSGSTG